MKFRGYIPTEYVTGYLRYGHGEFVVEADSAEDVMKRLEAGDICIKFVLDDYSVDGYEYDWSDLELTEE